MTTIDRTLAALAEPTRRRVIELLREHPRRPTELAEVMNISAPRMSQHLRMLRDCGLVEEQHNEPNDTRVRIYCLRRQPFDELQNWLRDVEAFWSDQLGAFREHVEKKRRT